MRKKAFCMLVALAVLLATTTVIDNTSATTGRYVGLKVGDTAEYTTTAWYANRVTLVVTNVDGSHINFNGTDYSSYGTVWRTYEFSCDVSDLSENGQLMFLVAANLTAGDAILTYDNVTISIQSTGSKEVAGHQRSVNHAANVPLGILPHGNVTATDQPYGISMYWDQATGIMVEARISTMMGYEDWKLVSMNVSTTTTTPDYVVASLLIVGGLVAVASVVTIAIIANRRRLARSI